MAPSVTRSGHTSVCLLRSATTVPGVFNANRTSCLQGPEWLEIDRRPARDDHRRCVRGVRRAGRSACCIILELEVQHQLEREVGFPVAQVRQSLLEWEVSRISRDPGQPRTAAFSLLLCRFDRRSPHHHASQVLQLPTLTTLTTLTHRQQALEAVPRLASSE